MNGSTKNFQKMFFGYLIQNETLKCFCFNLFSVVPEKPYVDQEYIFLRWDEIGSLGLHGISPKLNKTAQTLEIWCYVFPWGLHKLPCQTFRLSCFRSAVQKSLFWEKDPGRLHVTFSEFSQRPKVSLIVIVIMKNISSRRSFCRIQEISVADERHHASL